MKWSEKWQKLDRKLMVSKQGIWSELGVLLDHVPIVVLVIQTRNSIVTREFGLIMTFITTVVLPKAASPPPWSFIKSNFPKFPHFSYALFLYSVFTILYNGVA